MFLKIGSHRTRLIVLYTRQNFVSKEVDILNKSPIMLAKRIPGNKNKEVKTSRSPEIYSYLELKKNYLNLENWNLEY